MYVGSNPSKGLRKAMDEAYGVAGKIRLLPQEEVERASESNAYLADLMFPILNGISWTAFQYLDENLEGSGSFCGRFWMLRRLRNDPTFGPRMFKLFKRR